MISTSPGCREVYLPVIFSGLLTGTEPKLAISGMPMTRYWYDAPDLPDVNWRRTAFEEQHDIVWRNVRFAVAQEIKA
jgi:hypothetical protein